MISSHLQIKSLAVAEYLLLLEPRKDLCDTIIRIKQNFHDKYKAEDAIASKPHITLVNFVQYNSFEDRIRQKLRTVAIGFRPFQVELMDFGSFPSHTIYMNVISRHSVQELVKAIRTETQAILKLDKDNKPHFIMEPHITIARRLKPWQYEQGWLEYSRKNFTGKFIAVNMILLRRSFGEKKYTTVERFEFQDMPVTAKQVQLF